MTKTEQDAYREAFEAFNRHKHLMEGARQQMETLERNVARDHLSPDSELMLTTKPNKSLHLVGRLIIKTLY